MKYFQTIFIFSFLFFYGQAKSFFKPTRDQNVPNYLEPFESSMNRDIDPEKELERLSFKRSYPTHINEIDPDKELERLNFKRSYSSRRNDKIMLAQDPDVALRQYKTLSKAKTVHTEARKMFDTDPDGLLNTIYQKSVFDYNKQRRGYPQPVNRY